MADVELISLRCKNCGQEITAMANGVLLIESDLNPFCPYKDCEDEYASKL
jgi:hypothetical protein